MVISMQSVNAKYTEKFSISSVLHEEFNSEY